MNTTTEFVGGPITETITAFQHPPNDGVVGAQSATNRSTNKSSRHR